MLSLSINKNLDYSAPIFFVPIGTVTTSIKQAPIKKNIAKKTTAPIKKPTSAITSKPVSSFAKAPADTQNKTAPEKKSTTVAAVIPKKIESIKQESPKPEIKKIETVKKEVASSFDKLRTSEESIAQALDIQQTITPVIPEDAHISHNYREVEALRKQSQLQKEIVQTWKPPIGVSPDCMCEVSFFVNSTGKIGDIKMVKSSGVMMFDISARQALFATKMPQWTYGKPFTINFKQ